MSSIFCKIHTEFALLKITQKVPDFTGFFKVLKLFRRFENSEFDVTLHNYTYIPHDFLICENVVKIFSQKTLA